MRGSCRKHAATELPGPQPKRPVGRHRYRATHQATQPRLPETQRNPNHPHRHHSPATSLAQLQNHVGRTSKVSFLTQLLPLIQNPKRISSMVRSMTRSLNSKIRRETGITAKSSTRAVHENESRNWWWPGGKRDAVRTFSATRLKPIRIGKNTLTLKSASAAFCLRSQRGRQHFVPL